MNTHQISAATISPSLVAQTYDGCALEWHDVAGGVRILGNHRPLDDFLATILPQPGGMLDIGCGNGKHLVTQRGRGWNVWGCDLSRRMAKAANELLGDNIAVADAARLPFRAGQFACVTARQILQHVASPAMVIGEMRRVTHRNGCVLIQVPAPGYLRPLVAFQHGPGKDPLGRFSRAELWMLLARNGFRPEIHTARFVFRFRYPLDAWHFFRRIGLMARSLGYGAGVEQAFAQLGSSPLFSGLLRNAGRPLVLPGEYLFGIGHPLS